MAKRKNVLAADLLATACAQKLRHLCLLLCSLLSMRMSRDQILRGTRGEGRSLTLSPKPHMRALIGSCMTLSLDSKLQHRSICQFGGGVSGETGAPASLRLASASQSLLLPRAQRTCMSSLPLSRKTVAVPHRGSPQAPEANCCQSRTPGSAESLHGPWDMWRKGEVAGRCQRDSCQYYTWKTSDGGVCDYK